MELTLTELLTRLGGRLVNADSIGNRAAEVRLKRPAPLAGSGDGEVAFFFSREYERDLLTASPSVLVTGEAFVFPLQKSGLPLWKQSAVVAVPDPYVALARVSAWFWKGETESPNVHPGAWVARSARVGKDVSIGPGVSVGEEVEIGDGTLIHPGCHIAKGVKIGSGCVLYPSVTIYEGSVLGDRVRVHANSVIGADGFGYAPVLNNGNVVDHLKIYHLGGVRVGDDVEIGAGTTVDRGTFGDTWIGSKAKIDNQVQIGHNARVEDGAVICGNTALAGSSVVKRFAYVGGGTGIINHIVVGEHSKVAAHTLVSKDVPPGEVAAGNPQRSYKDHFKAHAALNRLAGDRRRKK